MMNLLKSLGITEEDLKQDKEKREKKEKMLRSFEEKWKPWKEKNLLTAKGFERSELLFNRLDNSDESDILIIKPTKKNLNEIIKFSTSKYNDYKKSDFVRWCYEELKEASPELPISGTPQVTTGCFSAGAHGQGGKKGSTRFKAKFTNSGTYELVVVFGMPFLILDSGLTVLFEGFDYKKPKIITKLMKEYEEYKRKDGIEELPF